MGWIHCLKNKDTFYRFFLEQDNEQNRAATQESDQPDQHPVGPGICIKVQREEIQYYRRNWSQTNLHGPCPSLLVIFPLASNPQALWHQGPVSQKTVFPQTRGGGDSFHFAHSPTAHPQLCSPVPNRPQTLPLAKAEGKVLVRQPWLHFKVGLFGSSLDLESCHL